MQAVKKWLLAVIIGATMLTGVVSVPVVFPASIASAAEDPCNLKYCAPLPPTEEKKDSSYDVFKIFEKISATYDFITKPELLLTKLANAVMSVIAFLLITMLKPKDEVIAILWEQVVNQTAPSAMWAKLWAQMWWLSAGMLIIVLTIQAGRIITADEKTANAAGLGGRKMWLNWLTAPFIGAFLARISMTIVDLFVNMQNMIWRSVLAGAIEAEAPAFEPLLPLLKSTGKLIIQSPSVHHVISCMLLPKTICDVKDAVELNKGTELLVGLVVGILILVLTLALLLASVGSWLLLGVLATVGPVYFALAGAGRDPRPGAGWIGLVVQTSLVQVIIGVMIRFLVAIEAAKSAADASGAAKTGAQAMGASFMGVIYGGGILHFILYALAVAAIVFFWLLPLGNAIVKIGTLNGGAVMSVAGGMVGAVGGLLAAGGAKVGSGRMVRAGQNVAKSGRELKETGQEVKATDAKWSLLGSSGMSSQWITDDTLSKKADAALKNHKKSAEQEARKKNEAKDGKKRIKLRGRMKPTKTEEVKPDNTNTNSFGAASWIAGAGATMAASGQRVIQQMEAEDRRYDGSLKETDAADEARQMQEQIAKEQTRREQVAQQENQAAQQKQLERQAWARRLKEVPDTEAKALRETFKQSPVAGRQQLLTDNYLFLQAEDEAKAKAAAEQAAAEADAAARQAEALERKMEAEMAPVRAMQERGRQQRQAARAQQAPAGNEGPSEQFAIQAEAEPKATADKEQAKARQPRPQKGAVNQVPSKHSADPVADTWPQLEIIEPVPQPEPQPKTAPETVPEKVPTEQKP